MAAPDEMTLLQNDVAAWREAWATSSEPPMLAVTDVGDDCYLLVDTRGLPDTQQLHLIDRDQAAAALAGRSSPAALHWARDNRLLVELDTAWVPLATASPALLEEFEVSTAAAA